MPIIKERDFDFHEVTSPKWTVTDNLAAVIEQLCESKDTDNDHIYDYYSIAVHVKDYLDGLIQKGD